MLKRKRPNADSTSKRSTLLSQKPGWSILLVLLCICVMQSCGTSPSSATAIRRQPPPTVAAHLFHAMRKTLDGDFAVTLDITPNRSGTNIFRVRVMDTRTDKQVTQGKITLYTTMQDMPMGTDSIVLHTDGTGQFSATSDTLSMGGHWAIGITIQTSDQTIHKVGVGLVIPV